MNFQQLAARIERFKPAAGPREVARFCLLLANCVEDVSQLDDEQRMADAWHETSLRVQAATDQHAAMTAELEELARSDPKNFDPEQIWVLVRAIKVQSQILQLYVGEPVLDV